MSGGGQFKKYTEFPLKPPPTFVTPPRDGLKMLGRGAFLATQDLPINDRPLVSRWTLFCWWASRWLGGRSVFGKSDTTPRKEGTQ
ncbi:MAG: hypothetical protein GEU73_05040 [Chloroflexi bacterium]|nr:hypothetical protein [Chloroflexota bacterium]